jgi:single-stranded DNA-binding protein
MFTMTGHGRLVAEPHLQQVGNNQSLVNFRLINNRWTSKGEVPEVVTFFCFGDLAEKFASVAVKGQIVYATGVQETSKGKTREGAEREYVQYRLLHFTLGPKPRAAGDQGGGEGQRGGESRPRPQAPSGSQGNQSREPYQQRSAPAQRSAGGADGGSMDDRPFFGDDEPGLI